MRLIDADAVKEALRNRISENIDECINNVPTVDVLDKIRTEIIKSSTEDYEYHGCGTDELIIETSEALNILNKYMAESEDEE